jgi:hypothetical protein
VRGRRSVITDRATITAHSGISQNRPSWVGITPTIELTIPTRLSSVPGGTLALGP